jgi:hypothetical protein
MTLMGPAPSKLYGRMVGPENSVDLCGESDDVRTLLGRSDVAHSAEEVHHCTGPVSGSLPQTGRR